MRRHLTRTARAAGPVRRGVGRHAPRSPSGEAHESKPASSNEHIHLVGLHAPARYRDMICRAPRRSCLRVRPEVLTERLTAALRRGARQLRCPGGRRPLTCTATRAALTRPRRRPAEPPVPAPRARHLTFFGGFEGGLPLRTLPITPGAQRLMSRAARLPPNDFEFTGRRRRSGAMRG